MLNSCNWKKKKGKKKKTEITNDITVLHIYGSQTRQLSHQSSLTTEEFRGPNVGRAPGVHLFGWLLQTSIKVPRFAGLVAHFTSVRPFPQAEEATSHKNVKTPVISRSCEMKVGFQWSIIEDNTNNCNRHVICLVSHDLPPVTYTILSLPGLIIYS